MADLVDNMTNAEIRTKLAEYGLPIMPITASTRNLLIKKLKMVMDKGDGKSADSRRSLAKYSSGEDSDMDVSKTTKEKSKNRRATVAGTMLPPVTSKLRKPTPKKSDSPAKLDTDKDSESETEPIKTHEEVKTVTTRRITRMYKPSLVDHDEYETGSDSDVDIVKTSSTSYKSPTTTSLPYKSLSSRSDYISSTLPSTSVRSDAATSPLASSYSSYTSSSDLNSIRSRLGLSSAYNDRTSLGSGLASVDRPSLNTSTYRSSYKPASVPEEAVDSPYLSSYTRHFSALKSDFRSTHKDTDGANGSGNSAAKYPFYKSTYQPRGDYAPDLKTAGEKIALKNNLVSFALVGVVLIFFVVLSLMYMGIKGSAPLHIEDRNIITPLCKDSNIGFKVSETCVKEEDVPKAKSLLETIYESLNNRAVAVGCGESDDPVYMTSSDIVDYVKTEHRNAYENQIKEDLYNLHVLVLSNPKWGVSILSIDPYKKDEYVVLNTMEKVVLARSKGRDALAVLHASIPWRCSVNRFMYYAASVLAVLTLAGFVAYLIRKGVNSYTDFNKRRKDQIYSMVEQIIEVISQENSEEGADSAGQSMPISHVRDMLIAPQNREKMANVWEAAIKFLEKNESRVRFEVENVAGEEYRALRWVSPRGSPRSARARSWQGQAFETQEGSVNNLTVSPTPCLKIRHMVDKNDKNPDLKSVIRDAILEKCGPHCRILHLEIDRSTCCVYVKCATPADAGVVYQSLHGWWYEGNLITVKYLRLERYMDHFPSSPSVGPYLKLSGQ